MIGNVSHPFGDKFCNTAFQILFEITAFELQSPPLQIIFTDEDRVEHMRSEEFTVSLLCPQVLSPDFTPAHTFYSVPRINVISASGWSEAFVSASVLARKSHYSSEFLNIHAASYYEVFWTYKNNIAGGISAHVSAGATYYPTRNNPVNRRIIPTQGLWGDEDASDGFMKLGGSVFYGCGRIRDGRYLHFKYPTELHQGSHRATSLISPPSQRSAACTRAN
jgi:hypothetical protein